MASLILMLLRYFVVIGFTAEAIGLPNAEVGLFEVVAFGGGDGKDYLLVPIGDINGIEKRQTSVPTQHNISQVLTPLITGRWTANIDAQLQLSSMTGTSDPKCTMSICTGLGVCGAKKDIGNAWSTFSLKVQLRANEPQTIAFVITCSTPAYVALRNIVIPGSGVAATTTALRTMTATETPAVGTITMPATTLVSTFASIETQGASIGSAGSIIIRNECPNSWASMYGDQDFLHIPPGGLAIVPAKPMDRFGANVQLMSHSQLWYMYLCVTSTGEGRLGCWEPVQVKKRDGPAFPTHPRWVSDPEKEFAIGDRTFESNDILRLECTPDENYDQWLDDAPTANITISNTGCDGLTGSVHWYGNGALNQTETQISMAYAANTIANLLLPYPGPESAGFMKLQTWSRNEPGWLEGTFLSIDGTALENLAWTEYTLDGQPHSFEFVCNFTTQRPVGAMTQVAYSAHATTSTTTVTAEPTVEPFNPHEVFYRSNCRSGPMLVSAPNNPDFMVIHNEDSDHMGYVPVETRNYSISITPLNGRQLCTRHEFDQYEHCDWIGVQQTMPPREYELTLFCSDEQSIFPPDAPFGYSTVNLRIGDKCPYIIAQVDCVRDGRCTAHKFPGTTPTVSFQYALRELLRVKAVGSGWQKAYWSITYAEPGYEPMSFVQNRGKLLDITPLPFAGDMQVAVECIEDDVIGVSVQNDCNSFVVLSEPSSRDRTAVRSFSNFPFTLPVGDPVASFVTLDAQRICVYTERSGQNQDNCGVDNVSIGSLQDNDIVHVECTDSAPALDFSENAIPISLSMPTESKWIAVQIGCEQGNPCAGWSNFGSVDGFYLKYPVITPRASLRVKIFGADWPSRMYYVRWSVSFSGGHQESYIQDNGNWLELTVPFGATSIDLQGATEYEPLIPSSETSLARYNVEVTNICPSADAVIIGTAANPDSRLVFGGSSAITFGLDPADANVKFTQLNGRRLCVRSDRIGYRYAQCLDGPVFLSIPPGDRILLFCPDNPSRPGDLTRANTVRFQTSGSCAYIARQNACYDWIMGPCEYAVYHGPQDTSFLWQASELRFKAVGEGWTEARLTVTSTDRGTMTYTQQRGEFVFVDAADLSAPGVEITMECLSGQAS